MWLKKFINHSATRPLSLRKRKLFGDTTLPLTLS